MIAFIDNKDSFSFNIVQSLEKASEGEVKVFRSDECTVEDVAAENPTHIVVGPGPGNPDSAGISLDVIRHFAGKVPILGVCLGHQAIAQAAGAKIVRAKYIRHGIVENIKTDGRGIFRIVGKSGNFTRYHSLVVDESTLPEDFEVTARAKDGDIMGIRSKTRVLEGVQFHPESIASESGESIFKAFLNYRRENLPYAKILSKLINRENLSEEESSSFMDILTSGTMDERIMSAILVALSAKGYTKEEITGCARALLKKKRLLPISGDDLAEIVGTGGDGKGSFNISSLSALTAASCGQKMAKHGNRAVSSKSGAADFFESLGIKIDCTPEKTAQMINQTGFGFLMAPVYHSAMRFATPVRKILGIRTIMNILGPLLNPAGAKSELLGVYDSSLLENYARSAKSLGARRVMVVCSKDGYDEISPCALTDVFEIDENSNEKRYVINPADFGITDAVESELFGGSGEENAALALDVVRGAGRKTIRAAIGLNAGAVLYLGGKAENLQAGYKMALDAISDGRVLKKIEEVKQFSCS